MWCLQLLDLKTTSNGSKHSPTLWRHCAGSWPGFTTHASLQTASELARLCSTVWSANMPCCRHMAGNGSSKWLATARHLPAPQEPPSHLISHEKCPVDCAYTTSVPLARSSSAPNWRHQPQFLHSWPQSVRSWSSFPAVSPIRWAFGRLRSLALALYN